MLQTRAFQMIRAISFVLIFLVCMASMGAAFAELTKQETEKKLVKVQEKIRNSQQKLEQKRGELGGLEKQLRESEQNIGKLNQQLTVTETNLKQSQEKIAKLQAEEKQLQKQLSKHHNILYAQIRSEYQYGGQQKLKLLLNQQNPEKLGRNLIYYDYLHRARLSEIDKATKVLQSVNEVQAKILQVEEVAKQAKLSLLNEKQSLEQAQKQRKTAISSLNSNVSSEKGKLENLESNEKQLKGLIESLRSALADIPVFEKGKNFSKSQGKLYWPAVGKPSNKFGQKRNSARSKLYWQGVFIPSTEGNNVRSIYHGRVAFAEWMRGLGLLIIVDHGDGYMSLYGHNQSLFKQVGEWVEAGEKVAAVGNSGGNNKPGLYFEIRKQGSPINPAKWCVKSAASRSPASG
ncbi:MAG: peptidoglycan DD-metalloendopeptidase family protein [Gammaproteobacteria bacterium]|nr:MAG: peptidoglycan DD-metalloendopeptidase family protein [Gammaproteobacteria bacterium]